MYLGVSTTDHGYGAMRGTPVGRQLASGSSPALRDLKSFSAPGSMISFSPGLRAREMSPTKLLSGRQTPEKSTWPLASRGVGPVTAGGRKPPRPLPPSVCTLPPGGGRSAGLRAPAPGAWAAADETSSSAAARVEPAKYFIEKDLLSGCAALSGPRAFEDYINPAPSKTGIAQPPCPVGNSESAYSSRCRCSPSR